MKIIIVVSSARKGSSLYIAKQLAIELSMENVDIVQLSDYEIGYCTGCLRCDETHKCNIEDGMVQLLEKIISADTLVFITPARYSLLSGDAKVFIDRLNPTAVNGDIENKNFVAVAVGQTQKGEIPDSVDLAVKSLVNFADNAGMNVLGKYTIYSCYDKDDIKQNEDVGRICTEIVSTIQNKKNRSRIE